MGTQFKLRLLVHILNWQAWVLIGFICKVLLVRVVPDLRQEVSRVKLRLNANILSKPPICKI
jgi:hypothetical protein